VVVRCSGGRRAVCVVLGTGCEGLAVMQGSESRRAGRSDVPAAASSLGLDAFEEPVARSRSGNPGQLRRIQFAASSEPDSRSSRAHPDVFASSLQRIWMPVGETAGEVSASR